MWASQMAYRDPDCKAVTVWNIGSTILYHASRWRTTRHLICFKFSFHSQLTWAWNHLAPWLQRNIAKFTTLTDVVRFIKQLGDMQYSWQRSYMQQTHRHIRSSDKNLVRLVLLDIDIISNILRKQQRYQYNQNGYARNDRNQRSMQENFAYSTQRHQQQRLIEQASPKHAFWASISRWGCLRREMSGRRKNSMRDQVNFNDAAVEKWTEYLHTRVIIVHQAKGALATQTSFKNMCETIIAMR